MAYRSSFVEINSGDKLGEGYFNGIYNNLLSWSPPVGAILPWLKSFTGVPQTLPSGWMELDGSTISDADSPMNGETLPDLNGNNRFLRGNSTSGGTGGSSTHTLTIDEIPAHTHTYPEGVGGGTAAVDWTVNADYNREVSSTGGGNAHENKPPYYDVVWIIRFK